MGKTGKKGGKIDPIASQAKQNSLNANFIREKAIKNLVKGNTVITKCPYLKNYNRPGEVISRVDGGYMVWFETTKGSSCDGQVRKVFEVDGEQIIYSGTPEFVEYSQIIKYEKTNQKQQSY